MLQLDVPLSWFTRRFSRVPGTSRLLEPLRRWTVRAYDKKPERWITIRDFEGDLYYRIDRSAYMSSTIYWRGIHAFREASLVRRFLPYDGVFVDVGANQGELTLVAAQKARQGRVFSFEPMPQWYALLTENVQCNKLSHVHLINAALTEQPGHLEMFTSVDVESHHSFNEGLSTLYKNEYRSISLGHVVAMRMDDFFTTESLSRLDMIKIDVEGAEKFVLKGGLETVRRFKPSLILEFNEEMFVAAGYSSLELVTQLHDLGYTLHEVNGFGSLRSLRPAFIQNFACVYCRHETQS